MKKLFVVLFVLALSVRGAVSAAEPISVNTLNREEVVNFFQTVYLASEGVPIGWTGDVATCNAGTISQAYQDATLLRINYFRAMAGVPADIIFDEEKNAKCQQAALMMSAKGALSHDPDPGWACYTKDGAEAAGNSNLSLGNAGMYAISSQINDDGANNYFVGHRRWIFYPTAKSMGSGSVPFGMGHWGANALWVLGDRGDRPTRPAWVAWPPQGYIPYAILPSSDRWSFSYAGANFADASVSMEREGVSVALEQEQQENDKGYADNTLVWKPQGIPHPAIASSVTGATATITSTWTFAGGSQPPSGFVDPFGNNPPATPPEPDVTYTVTISNVIVNGAAQTFTYKVTLVDPKKVSVSGPRLSIQKNGDLAIIFWNDPTASLEEAGDSTGPWNVVAGSPSSPHVTLVSTGQKFYRLRK